MNARVLPGKRQDGNCTRRYSKCENGLFKMYYVIKMWNIFAIQTTLMKYKSSHYILFPVLKVQITQKLK